MAVSKGYGGKQAGGRSVKSVKSVICYCKPFYPARSKERGGRSLTSLTALTGGAL